MLTAPDGTILDANPAACRMLGRTREEILREGRQGLMDRSDPRLAAYGRGARTDRQSPRGTHGSPQGRHLFPVEVSSVLFRGRDGSPRTCIIIRDISRAKSRRSRARAADSGTARGLGEDQDSERTAADLCHPAARSAIKGQVAQSRNLRSKTHRGRFQHGICPECRHKLYPETIRS